VGTTINVAVTFLLCPSAHSKSTRVLPIFAAAHSPKYSVNPTSVVGVQFIFQPDFTDEVAYKVIQLGVTEEKMFYLVQFAGYADSIEVSKSEMEDMLQDGAHVIPSDS